MSDFETVSDGVEAVLDSKEASNNLEAANLIEDSVTFTKALWDLLRQQGLQADSSIPDIAIMEQTIDRIYGELAAACMMFTDDAYSKLPMLFVGVANKLQAANHEDVPNQLIQGFRDFAVRLENTQKTKKMYAEQPKEVKEM